MISMIDVIYSNAFSEVLEILKYVSKDDYEKIPLDIIELMEDTCSKDFVVKYNPNISLTEQGISEEARTIIAIFFRDYWATEKQREKILLKEKYDNYIEKTQKQKKCNLDNLFKNKQKETLVENTNLPVEIKKETFFKKLISFIKGLFNKTN